MNTGPLNEVFVLKRVAKWTYFAYTTQIDTPGGHLGIFWVGMCRPGLQIGTLF